MAEDSKEIVSGELKDSAVRIFRLQEDRVRVYQQLENYFSQYLLSGPKYDFTKFRSHVHEVTVRFQELSDGVRKVGEIFNVAGRKEAAALVAQLQEKEREKLEVTAAWQLQRQELADGQRDLEEMKNHVQDDDRAVDDKRMEVECARLSCDDVKQRAQSLMSAIQDIVQDLRYELEDVLLADED